jgi:hypothetical protein
MCPVCLTSIAITVATTAGAGGAVTALALRVKRALTEDLTTETGRRVEDSDHVDARSGLSER